MKPNELANKLVRNDVLLYRMAMLMYRWEDECLYEDFCEYTEVMYEWITSATEDSIELIDGTTEPFGIVFSLNGIRMHLYIKGDGIDYWLALKFE